MSVKTKEDYPLMLTAAEIQEIMNVSKTKAHDIMNLKSFPLLRVGRTKRVGRDAFFNWLDNQMVGSVVNE